MDAHEENLIKHREIAFSALHPDANQAQTATLVLADVPGIRHVHFVSPTFMRISYDVLQVSLEQIEQALQDMGFHLDNRLIYRLKRALYYYTEETQRANHGCNHHDRNCTKKIFVRHYQARDHGCRDNRPEHWRRYL